MAGAFRLHDIYHISSMFSRCTGGLAVTASSLRLAVAAGTAPPRAEDALSWVERRLVEAEQAQADLLVLPQQMFGACAEGEALLSDDPALRALARAVARHGVAAAFGYVEQCTGRRHHAVQMIDAGGLALANYRATHLGAVATAAGLSPGHWLNQVRLGDLAVGLLSDDDLTAPEPARALTLAGAVVLALPADTTAIPPDVTVALLRARAFENGCAVAFANRATTPASMIVGADGTPLAQAVDGIAVAEVPRARPPEAASRLAARRPLLYQRLSSPHAQDRALRN
jgi:predicted amidohydrolase